MFAKLPDVCLLAYVFLRFCKILTLERKCSHRVERMRSAVEGQLLVGGSGPDVWDRAASFFSVKKALIFHNGYNRSSREALRLFPHASEDTVPLCCQWPAGAPTGCTTGGQLYSSKNEQTTLRTLKMGNTHHVTEIKVLFWKRRKAITLVKARLGWGVRMP